MNTVEMIRLIHQHCTPEEQTQNILYFAKVIYAETVSMEYQSAAQLFEYGRLLNDTMCENEKFDYERFLNDTTWENEKMDLEKKIKYEDKLNKRKKKNE